MLSGKVEPRSVRDYLLQNLVRADGHWYWRINIGALQEGMEGITGFPQTDDLPPFTGPAHFVYGSESDYLRPEHAENIFHLFPGAEMHRIEGAGHWVYAEKPAEFLRIVRSVLFSSS